VGTRDVVELIASDQSLSARLLSLVNRAGSEARVTTVDRAAVLLGLNVVRNLVLSIQIFETFTQRVEKDDTAFDHVGFWKHSLAVGCAARLLATERNGRAGRGKAALDPEEAFMCGLLHDLGKVVLDSCFPKSYARVLARVSRMHENMIEAEQKVFGLDHTLAGKRLAGHWKLPPFVSDCIWLHHHTPGTTPSRLARPEMVHTVQLADRLVREMRIGFSGSDRLDAASEDLAREAGLGDDLVERVKQALPELIESRAALIGLDRLTSRDVYQEAMTHANAELARLNTTLQQANRRLEQRSVCLDALQVLNEALAPEDLHENVCKAAVRAAASSSKSPTSTNFSRAHLLPHRPIVLVAHSRTRQLLVTACYHDEQAEVRLRALRISERRVFGQVTSGYHWHPVADLSHELAEELENTLARPGRWILPLADQDAVLGALVISDDAAPEADDTLKALHQAMVTRLRLAEGQAQATRLNEELVEMNRALAASQAELTRARSLAMVGEMAAGAAHEMNNPLAVISGRAQILLQQIGDPDLTRSCQLIADHAHRASAIVNELIAFAKPDPPHPDIWSLAWLLGDIRAEWIATEEIREEEFELALSDEMPKVHADMSQSRKLFDEVIRNAIDAMREVTPKRLIINCSADLADEKIVVNVQDNGRGIAPEILDHVATPFFSHRQAGRGRGLGLSLAVRYAEINGGGIRISSQPGEGTTVSIILPAADRFPKDR